MEYPDEPPCETESAEFCSTTITKSETLVGTTTSTITKTESGCNTIYGCHLTDVGYHDGVVGRGLHAHR
jgi:hypothetical protein